MPAGFTPDGLPIGIELLGRPLADARLVALAYDYEQSVHPRRAPSTTPPLVDGLAPKPVVMTAVVQAGSVAARGDFAFDPTRRSLDYAVRVSGTPGTHVFSISLDRDSSGHKGPVLRHLSGAGIAQAKGRLTLNESDRRDLLAGHMSMVVYTADRPAGSIKGAIIAAPRP